MVVPRALFLDRDGVINIDHGYVHRPDQCEFVEGIFDMVRAFTQRDYLPVIVTNQAGIGRGLYGEDDFQAFMTWMRNEFRKQEVPIAAVYHCPDHPTAGIGVYRRENDWRKPGPGMMLQAAKDLDLDLTASWCVGDKMSDMDAARTAGTGTCVLYDTGAGAAKDEGDFWRVPALRNITQLLEKLEAT
jgi:D-glycero-D-manno-heptose 1,7-bisphosphate phosphatase